MARKPRAFFNASPWELEDAEEEDIDIMINHSPKAFVHENGKLTGMIFELMEYEIDDKGKIIGQKVTGETTIPCDDVILAIGQDNAFPWIDKDGEIEFDKWDVPVVDKTTFESTKKGVFFGGDAAFGPLNIIWAVEHGHQAAISIHNHCQGKDLTDRKPDEIELKTTKMGMSEWGYSNAYDPADRREMQHVDMVKRFEKLDVEVELGFSAEQIATEVERCLNCDVHTVFDAPLCEECDACIDICPVECLSIAPSSDNEADLRATLTVSEAVEGQDLYVSGALPLTGRVMIKDENVCLHCGLCAERCPTAAWDMQEGILHINHANEQELVRIGEARQKANA
jgi:ferredoxin